MDDELGLDVEEDAEDELIDEDDLLEETEYEEGKYVGKNRLLGMLSCI